MDINIVDTTLRDGEQKACIALDMDQKVKIAKILDKMGVGQIEAGVAAMDGEEKESIKKIMNLGLNSKISSWNRMNIQDIDDSMDCGVDIVHISIPSSDLQIKSKLRKDRDWVINNARKCIAYTLDKGYEVTIGLEDASRADINFLIELCITVSEMGVKRVRYADTVGILYPRKIFYHLKKLIQEVPLEIEIHAHNDFGMALANSLGAIEAGAKYVNCTVTGIGERAGNCDFLKFVKILDGVTGEKASNRSFDDLVGMEQQIREIINYA
ncbi:homocitrate synthase [Clostridium tyrobutyricum]|jgi:homocitrate synthase NifV|uniref:homocitrate synthase n=1 Tax=Clostridium tyrobutyricum TaxID=1519 RepID=UPI000316CF94|nr:homocitrate synthase [Clostridium tyrobutyricum]MBV4441567.1 homocitrate synthase [Clostridium tyrobutyricum]MBV4450473.1 homocitrate synthase [Clostridium tyrobutyricum]MEA5007341.1 homocitrate synthase [Clostridium tyrobutyricum]QCH28680.1 2-isopropylmalate synthase [Clostridium tyrobutyricum]